MSRAARVTLGTVTTLILAVIYLPLFVVFVNSFSTSTNLTWPPPGFTLEWWGKAFQNAGALEGITTSCLLYTSPSPRDRTRSRMPSSA